jgi:diacylglycerol O-acyltransferase / wax synthase
MPATARLSALDASFLEIESSTAHMHVGWVATFLPPADGSMPTFEELRDHIARRLCRAPRYRQRLAGVPLGLNAPSWVDAEDFDIADHVLHSTSRDVRELADMAFSVPLNRRRPLWEMWIADQLADGRIGVVGKAHHCLVDGIAAVELAGLLLDPSPNPAAPEPDPWSPQPAPGPLDRVAGGVRDLMTGQAGMLAAQARAVSRPRRLFRFAEDARRAASALAGSLDPAPPAPLINEPISPLRRLALFSRPLEDLRTIKRSFATTLNDAVLAVCAGGVRDFMMARGVEPERLKTMVPVNVRGDDAAADLGNRISFIFVDLPCDEPDPVERLARIHAATSERKAAGNPRGADSVLRALGFAPRPVQALAAHAAASSRAYNLTISNIPGPPDTVWMRGCQLEAAHPVIPLSDRHALSIGLTTIGDGAHFGVYCDRKRIPDADMLAGRIDLAVDELLALAA